MTPLDEAERLEYAALMNRACDAERVAQIAWVASGLVAGVLLSWAIGAKSPGLMLPVVMAAAFGFYAALRGRQQVRLIAGYAEEFFEGDGAEAGWFTRLQRLRENPAFTPSGDWIAAGLANAAVLLAVVLAWVFAGPAARGELMAGIVTGCGAAFGLHSLTETARLDRADYGGLWRQVHPGVREAKRPTRMASR